MFGFFFSWAFCYVHSSLVSRVYIAGRTESSAFGGGRIGRRVWGDTTVNIHLIVWGLEIELLVGWALSVWFDDMVLCCISPPLPPTLMKLGLPVKS